MASNRSTGVPYYYSCVLGRKATAAKKPRYSSAQWLVGSWITVTSEPGKTTSLERQPDCFSTHTQDPITNSLCKFPWWQPAPNKLMAPLLLYVGQGNQRTLNRCYRCQLRSWPSYHPSGSKLPRHATTTVIWIWRHAEESFRATNMSCKSCAAKDRTF